MPLATIREALLEPEAFAVRWGAEERAPLSVYLGLGATASAGMGTYGAMLHAWRGGGEALEYGLAAVAAAGLGWSAAVPSLVILGGLFGSRLAPRSTLLASLVAVCFGGLALVAAVPILWFFEITTGGATWARGLALAATSLGVGLCMTDVFCRVMKALEGGAFFHFFWVCLFGAVTLEIFVLFGLHHLV